MAREVNKTRIFETDQFHFEFSVSHMPIIATKSIWSEFWVGGEAKFMDLDRHIACNCS
jgi:hypothetical protein